MAIPFLREPPPTYGEVFQLSPLVRCVVARNPGPFTYTGTRTHIVGRGEVAVIDPGPLLPDHLKALLDAVAGERVTDILVTHTHLDHSPLAASLAERTGARVHGRRAPPTSGGEGQDVAFRPDVILEDGERIEGPGWSLTALETPGHASNHVAFHLPQERAVLPGDLVMGWSTSIVSPPDGDMDAYLASLDRVQALGAAVLHPTHGPAVTDPASFIDALREHRLARERALETALACAAEPRTAAELTPGLYADVAPALHPAATRSLLAHLVRLVRLGRARADGDPLDPATRFAAG